ncbi:MAG: hypothetical protein NZM44_05900, partial [Candidatus Calescibacterium sp.]|nr:hypothetical protein [Candidatus Calescibacterium sp.]
MSFEYSIQNNYRNSWYSYGPSINSFNFYGYNNVSLSNYLYGAFGGFGGFSPFGGFGGFYGGFGGGVSGLYNMGMGFSYNSLTPIYRNVVEQNDVLQTGKIFDYKFSSVDGRVQEGERLVNSEWVGRRDPVII